MNVFMFATVRTLLSMRFHGRINVAQLDCVPKRNV